MGDLQLPLKLQDSLEALDPPGYSLEGKMPPSQGVPPSAGQTEGRQAEITEKPRLRAGFSLDQVDRCWLKQGEQALGKD